VPLKVPVTHARESATQENYWFKDLKKAGEDFLRQKGHLEALKKEYPEN